MKRVLSQLLLVMLMLLGAHLSVAAQDSLAKKNPLKISGSASSSTDMRFGPQNPVPRVTQLPPLLQRFNVNLNIAWRKFKLPISFVVMIRPDFKENMLITEKSIKEFFQNPRHQFRLQPTIGKNTFYIGPHVPQITPLTAGNIAYVTGVGYAREDTIVHGKISIGTTFGAQQADSTRRQVARLERKMVVSGIGFGNPKRTSVGLAYVRAWDKPDSTIAGAPDPVDGAVMSLHGRVGFLRTLYWKNEFAFSVINLNAVGGNEPSQAIKDAFVDLYDENDTDKEKKATNLLNFIGFLFPMGTQMRIGFAENTEVGLARPQWGLAVGMNLITPSYRSLAQYSQLTGYTDLTSRGNYRSENGKLQFDATAGVRRDNVSVITKMIKQEENPIKDDGPRNERFIGSANVAIQPIERLFLGASFSNFGTKQVLRDTIYPDSLTVQLSQINRSIGCNAALNLGKQQNHSLSLNAMLDMYTSIDGISTTGGETKSAGINYQVTTPKFTTYLMGLNAFESVMDSVQFDQYTLNAGIQQSLLKRRLQVMAQVQYGISPGFEEQKMRGLSGSLNYKPNKHLQFMIRGNCRVFGSRDAAFQTRVNFTVRYIL